MIKAFGFMAFFFLLIVGMQHVELPGFYRAGAGIAGGIVIAVALLVLSRLVKMDGESLADIGVSFSLSDGKQFLVGTGLGLVVIACMIGVLLLVTPLDVQLSANSSIVLVLGASFLILFALALMEEIVFRSYPLFKLQQAWGIRPAIYLTSVAFAFYHGFAFESLLGPGVWGLIYGWMAVTTKSIALPTGFHLGLNWGQAILGAKPQYSDSIWALSISDEPRLLGVETMGVVFQLIFLVVGVVLIEKLIAKQVAE